MKPHTKKSRHRLLRAAKAHGAEREKRVSWYPASPTRLPQFQATKMAAIAKNGRRPASADRSPCRVTGSGSSINTGKIHADSFEAIAARKEASASPYHAQLLI